MKDNRWISTFAPLGLEDSGYQSIPMAYAKGYTLSLLCSFSTELQI